MKQITPYYTFLICYLILLCFIQSCKQSQTSDKEHPIIEEGDSLIKKAVLSQATTKNVDTVQAFEEHLFCFAQKSEAVNYPNEYNYEFIRLEKDDDGKVTGQFYVSYFGKDEAKGHLKGVWNKDKQAFDVTAEYLAEGETYKEQRTYAIKEDHILLGYQTPDGQEASLPRINCEIYKGLFKEYQQGFINHFLNTTDRSRLKKVMTSQNLGYSEEDLDKLKFLEAMVDLNHDPSDYEYLLYVMDPMLCGTGGCNLFILNKSGEVLSEISVTRPPIYVPITSFENDQKQKGEWKELYVYSKGYRRLVPKNGQYPTNASMAPEILEAQLLNFPNAYRLVMDYLD
ncbi:hypothetical protein [Mangrovimonas sp. DI 80]|uniref:hypothetical protein n=1 Tax=Mangrovimonas sp. DI 80 TaxID=1779330 RepID=UPI000976D43E|nr:hypothetical protein [Mangrovimonas sp. DI 80]OMP30205.1 hypothetical protein BKM32_12540 [Mangrovimonas sp. DI 80]